MPVEPVESSVIAPLLASIALAMGLTAAGHALLNKRRPRAAFGWLAVCLTFPFAGAVLYFLFGINRIRTRARRLRGGHADMPAQPGAGVPAPPALEPLARLGRTVSDAQLVSGNAVQALHNGEQAFPAMLEAIDAASRSVLLASYIFESNATGRDFVDALGRAAGRGVDVRVLLDGFGELYSWPRVRRLLGRAGVRVERFLPPRLVPPAFRVNLRNHRKILLCDDAVAFVGGMNIGDRHLAADVTNPKRVVDLHFRLQGPVVRQVRRVFADDWAFVTDDPLPPAAAAPAAAGSALCRTVADGPDEDLDKLTTLLLAAFGVARRRIAIMTPYFLPPRELIGALQAAALRGVDVAIILPAVNNLPYVHRATRNMLWELLQRGVQFYYQPAPFVHSKLLIIDEEYVQLGSANLDPRSLRLNFELVIEVYSQSLAREMLVHFDAVRAASERITLDHVDRRSLVTRLVDGTFWLFSPYL